MTDPAPFDTFYAAARDRLLLQAYALTGDLPAARRAVRDSFVEAWHHWRKVSRLPDPEAWVRPNVWLHAQRRHTTRIWHRDKGLDADIRATLAALGTLTWTQRRLVLGKLFEIPLEVLARDTGLPLAEAREEFETAAARFALHREIDRFEVPETLAALAQVTDELRWPRATIVRRAGTARRRTHTAVAAVVALVALIGAGSLVAVEDGVPLSLAQERITDAPYAVRTNQQPRVPRLLPAQLLTADQAGRLGSGEWRTVRTSDNTTGEGTLLPCQPTRFADPAALGSLVRVFGPAGKDDKAKGKRKGKEPARQRLRVVQTAELSASRAAAREAYRTSRTWYAACLAGDHLQLVSTHEVRRVGDAAHLFVLRSRRDPGTVHTFAITRTGQLTTTLYRRERGRPAATGPAVSRVATLLASAVNRFCGRPGAAGCAGPPKVREIPPFPAAPTRGMLATVDLPGVGVGKPWVGTEVHRAKLNVAATRCDETDFDRKGMRRNLTRSFLIPEAKLPDTFGITETKARLGSEKAARALVRRVRGELAGCEDEDLASTAQRLAHRDSRHRSMTVWRVTTEISDQRSIRFLMAIFRDGRDVGQLGFVPADRARMAVSDFVALAERARTRLGQPAVRPVDEDRARAQEG